ncbi:MAG: tetratricopeptide repeat protein [Deltaproteobacteria bacterium]|nr:MAG: tetratricopeptide repeat protein [Deltaproteobacteria bacterium]
MTSPPGQAPARRLGPYQIVGQLGAGGMGEVWLARDTRLEREVALKVLPAQLSVSPEALAGFRNEALALASLNHPNIATIHGFEEIPGGPMVLVLERVEGESLASRLARAPLAVDEALQIAAQIAYALEVAHERGVVHRDLKPGNVMLGPRGLVKVLDFGLAKRTHGLVQAPADGQASPAGPPAQGSGSAPAQGPATVSGPVAGTPGYMSPEQVLAGTQDQRTDVFAFGCVLYELLSGRRAFPADDPYVAMAQVLNDTPDPAALPERTPGAIRALLERCLAKDPQARPAAMRELRIQLEESLGIRRASALREGGAVATPHNLPAPATSFVGRAETLAACTRSLGETRLLTLTAIGGAGKTRLALMLAESQLDTFRDGVWFVDVAPLTEPARLVESLAAALDVRDEPGRTLLDGVLARLAARRALVLLDNAEAQSEACAELASHLLRACPQVKLVVTHRASLGVEGETLFSVPPLSVPDAGVRDAGAAAVSEAVRLFCERARAASPAFELTDASAATVAEICRRLDGIPLALELAATRVRLLGVEQIRARLGDRFKLLTRSASGPPSRQQTVLAVIQWSWDHLLEPEQDLLRRLAVFTGGWTLERATAVCADGGDEFEVLDLLTRLVERSLVVVQHGLDHGTRYRFLESVWRFALDQLEGHLEHEPLRERHLAVYLALAEHSETAMSGPGLPAALRELTAEEDNLLAAFAWCARADSGAEQGLRLAASAQRFWMVSGRYALGLRLQAEALARDTRRRPSPIRARVLARAAGFALAMGDYERARPYLEESLAVCRATGDEKGIARALAGLGVVAMYQSRLEEGIAIGEESLAAYQQIGEKRGVAMALHNLASIEWALHRGDLGRARFETALGMLREVGDAVTEVLCLAALASTLVRLGEKDLAAKRLREALTLATSMDMPREAVAVLESMAEWLMATGNPADSARMLAAAGSARAGLAWPYLPLEAKAVAALSERVTESLGPAERARQEALGAGLQLAHALAEAIALANRIQ